MVPESVMMYALHVQSYAPKCTVAVAQCMSDIGTLSTWKWHKKAAKLKDRVVWQATLSSY